MGIIPQNFIAQDPVVSEDLGNKLTRAHTQTLWQTVALEEEYKGKKFDG